MKTKILKLYRSLVVTNGKKIKKKKGEQKRGEVRTRGSTETAKHQLAAISDADTQNNNLTHTHMCTKAGETRQVGQKGLIN